MSTLVRFVIVLTCVGAPLSAQVEGPFGLRMGMSKEELTRVAGPLRESQPGMFWTEHVPRPHTEFENYLLVVTPTHGLCKMAAIGENVSMNSFGDGLKERFTSTRNALELKYGGAETLDFLKSGSIWDEPNDWAMAMKLNERTLAAYWSAKNVADSARIALKLTSIALVAAATSTTSGYVRLTYEFTNVVPCLALVAKMRNTAF